jgi:hypothetical protein
MAQCVSPWTKEINGQKIPLPCGKCFECKARRVSSWSFRLMKEAERSSSALFITLTYNNQNLPRTPNGFKNLCKEDLIAYMKKLRKLNKNKLKYYTCGEYGTKTKRPHYHQILFNADPDTIAKAWKFGDVHIGKVEHASVGYTLKYISKTSVIPMHSKDDRLKEFSNMSKRMGDNYLTDAMIKWHKKDLVNRVYCNLTDGKKIALPRYYKDKMYNSVQKMQIQTAAVLRDEEAIRKGLNNLSTTLKDMHREDLIRINKSKKHQNDTRKTIL